MTRRDFVRTIAVAGMATPILRAQNKADKAKEIIDKTVRALGGDAFSNLQYRVETGRAYSFYHEQISGLSVARVYTKYLPPDSAAPIKMVQRQVLGKKQDESVIFTDKEIWDVTYRGAKQLPQERLDYFHESTMHDIFYILRQRLNEPGLGMEYQGPDVVENQSAEKVEIFDAENRSVLVWISATKFHPIQQRFTRWDPSIKDRREEVTQYSTYRDCGNGVMLPWTTERDRDKERIFQMYSSHVTVTQPIPDSMFELPAGVTILKK
jgi:hypothetical protein